MKNYPIKMNKLWLYVVILTANLAWLQNAAAQCSTPPPISCSNTDLTNYGFNSNNNAATLEYDNYVAGFHQSAIRASNGTFQVWGEDMGANGVLDILTPITINSTNYPALTGTPLKVAMGGANQNNTQAVLLTTTGLFACGDKGSQLLNTGLTSSDAFQKITVDGKTDGLPTGVSPGDVKMLFGTSKTLVITTCSGDVWVLSDLPNYRGNGATGSAIIWSKVTTSQSGNPFLTNVVAVRGNGSSAGLIALKTDGSVWVWGDKVFLGNTNAGAVATRATQMTLPAGAVPKMVGATANGSYYLLATDGNLYSIGVNSSNQLGDWTTIERRTWVQPRYTSATGLVMNDIKWISPQEHDASKASINAINTLGTLFAWGDNDSKMLGLGSDFVNPATPSGLTASDKILAVETGGHTSMIVKECSGNFGYVGHRINGSMGNGSSVTAAEPTYTFATAPIQLCGAETILLEVATTPAPLKGPTGKYCNGSTVGLIAEPAGGTLTFTGPATLSGTQLTFTGTGTPVVVTYSITNLCTQALTITTTLETEDCLTTPVKFISFTGQANANTTVLNWVMGLQDNVKSYVVQYSNTGAADFKTVGTLNATLNNNYNFTHTNPLTGIGYYRLMITELDGKITYSNIVKINFGLVSAEVTLYPNPVKSVLNVNVPSNMYNKSCSVEIFSVDGKVLLYKKINNLSQTEIFNLSKFANGKYIVRIITNNQVINKQIEVLK